MGSSRAIQRAMRAARDRNLYGGGNLTFAANHYTTPAGGGERGVASGGFGTFVSLRIKQLAGPLTNLFLTTGTPNVSGWHCYLTAVNALAFWAQDGSTTFRGVTAMTLSPSDVGRVFVFYGLHGGSYLRAATSRLQHSQIQSTFTPGYTAPTAGETQWISGDIAVEPLAAVCFRGIPSDATIVGVFDYARDRGGEMPSAISGVTVTFGWSFKKEIQRAGLGAAVVDGQAGPATLTDLVSGAALGLMSKVGSPILRKTYRKPDGRMTYGAQGATTAAYLRSTLNLDSATAFWFSWYGVIWSAASGTRVLISNRGTGTGGWDVYTSGARASLVFEVVSAANVDEAAIVTLAANDLSRPRLYQFSYDGAATRVYAEGVLLQTKAFTGRLLASDGVLALGAWVRASVTQPDEASSFFSFAGGVGALPTLGELQAQAAEVERTGRIAEIAGKTTVRYEPTIDVEANGGPDNGVPATVLDRVGSSHLTCMGSLTVAQRADRDFSYETRPIMYGGETFSAANFYSVAGGFAGDPNGFGVDLAFTVTSQTAATRILLAKRGAGNPGFHIATVGSNSLLQFSCGNASASVSTPSGTIAAADVGKLLFFSGVWDFAALKARAYFKRAELGTGNALAGGFTADNASPFTLGKRSDGFGADSLRIYGARLYNFTPTLAEHQSACDRLMAHERFRSTDYPGRTLAHMYWFPDGVTPSTLSDLIGSAHLAQNGAPTVSGHYARNWGW